MTTPDLGVVLLDAFPVADDRCDTTDDSGRRCVRAAWHHGGRPEWGEGTPHRFDAAPEGSI